MNETDCLTLEPINKIRFEELIILNNGNEKMWKKSSEGEWKKSSGKKYNYAFKVSSLYSMMKEGRKTDGDLTYFVHPYTREKISYRPLKRHILFLKKLQKNLNYNINLEFKNEIEEELLSEEKKLELKTISLFQKIDEFGHITNYNWFFRLNSSRLIRFIRELIDVWEYRAQLTIEMKRKICPLVEKEDGSSR